MQVITTFCFTVQLFIFQFFSFWSCFFVSFYWLYFGKTKNTSVCIFFIYNYFLWQKLCKICYLFFTKLQSVVKIQYYHQITSLHFHSIFKINFCFEKLKSLQVIFIVYIFQVALRRGGGDIVTYNLLFNRYSFYISYYYQS